MADDVAQANRNGRAATEPLHVRWLGRVGYDEAYSLQQQLQRGDRNHLLLLEHPPVFTLGRSADAENILIDPDDVGAIVRNVDRGGDVTVHAPGQLVGYLVLTVPGRSGLADTAKFVATIEDLLIDVLVGLHRRVARCRRAECSQDRSHWRAHQTQPIDAWLCVEC